MSKKAKAPNANVNDNVTPPATEGVVITQEMLERWRNIGRGATAPDKGMSPIAKAATDTPDWIQHGAMAYDTLHGRRKVNQVAPATSPNGGYDVPASTAIPSRAKDRAESATGSMDKGTASVAANFLKSLGVDAPYGGENIHKKFDEALFISDAFDATDTATLLPWTELSADTLGGGEADRFRHFYWQSKLTQKYGFGAAMLIGLAHELEGVNDQAQKLIKGEYSFKEWATNMVENFNDLGQNEKAQTTVALMRYLRGLKKMPSDLTDSEIFDMAVASAKKWSVEDVRKKREAYRKELRNDPAFIKWQNDALDGALTGKANAGGDLRDFLRLRELQKLRMQEEEDLGKRNLERINEERRNQK
jgi:hypothetical protein